MKTLILVRHAKAEEKTDSEHDFERSLTVEGVRDAGIMGIRLHSMKTKADAVISSPANRAVQTAEIIHDKISSAAEITTIKEIYMAKESTLMKIIKKLNDNLKTVIIVGHNPSLNHLLDMLCETNVENIPKGAIVGIKLDIESWRDVSQKCGTLTFFDSPKNMIKHKVK